MRGYSLTKAFLIIKGNTQVFNSVTANAISIVFLKVLPYLKIIFFKVALYLRKDRVIYMSNNSEYILSLTIIIAFLLITNSCTQPQNNKTAVKSVNTNDAPSKTPGIYIDLKKALEKNNADTLTKRITQIL